jgi:hypothetical protein
MENLFALVTALCNWRAAINCPIDVLLTSLAPESAALILGGAGPLSIDALRSRRRQWHLRAPA